MFSGGFPSPKAQAGLYDAGRRFTKVDVDPPAKTLPPYHSHPQHKYGGPVYFPGYFSYTSTNSSSSGYGYEASVTCEAAHKPRVSAEQRKHAVYSQPSTGSPTSPFAASGSQYGSSPTSIFHPLGLSALSCAGCPSAQYPSELKLHSHLRFSLKSRWTTTARPGLVWDIILPPQVSRVVTVRNIVVEPDLGAPAMEPAPERLELWTGHAILACYMRKWGPVVVKQSDPTVEAVLGAIYDYLHTTLSQNDLQLVRSSSENAGLLEMAREERARDGFELYDVTIKGPFRRSDVVGGHRRFQGIRAVKLEDGSHRLFFNLGPGPVPRY